LARFINVILINEYYYYVDTGKLMYIFGVLIKKPKIQFFSLKQTEVMQTEGYVRCLENEHAWGRKINIQTHINTCGPIYSVC
jgi:hypothetical protein